MTLIALCGCAITTTACAGLGPRSAPVDLTAAPPRLETPAAAEASCPLYRLPPSPTQKDLEVGYETRGLQILFCDGFRDLAVQTHRQEHRLEDLWLEARRDRRKRWWKFW